MHVPTEAAQLGYTYRAAPAPRLCQSSGKLWPTLESVTALPGLDLHKYPDDLEAFRLSEAFQRLLMRLNTKPRFTLLAGRNSDVPDQRSRHDLLSVGLYQLLYVHLIAYTSKLIGLSDAPSATSPHQIAAPERTARGVNGMRSSSAIFWRGLDTVSARAPG